ncbi:MAG: transcription antitermination factor NusB [Bacillota bacterium]
MKKLSRHEEREIALQFLYALDNRGRLEQDFEPQSEEYIPWLKEDHQSEDDYYLALVRGVCHNLAEIDKLISEKAKGWSLKRIAIVDRNILRIAIFEIKYNPRVPEAVAINEAVELAQEYCSDKSPSFINGILGKI